MGATTTLKASKDMKQNLSWNTVPSPRWAPRLDCRERGSVSGVNGASTPGPEVKLVLRGGKSFYQGKWQTSDVGIDAAGKLRLGSNLRAPEILDVSNKVVAPGFIDILADNAANPESTFPIFEKFKVSDGVTTGLQMHGGSLIAPPTLKGWCVAPLDQLRRVDFVMEIRNHRSPPNVASRWKESDEGARRLAQS